MPVRINVTTFASVALCTTSFRSLRNCLFVRFTPIIIRLIIIVVYKILSYYLASDIDRSDLLNYVFMCGKINKPISIREAGARTQCKILLSDFCTKLELDAVDTSLID